MYKTFIWSILLSALLVNAAEYKLNNIKLTLAGKKYQAAYDDLKYHLELAAGKLSPGKDALEIIVGKAGNKAKLKAGEARYLYRNGKLYIWGRDQKKMLQGTSYAVSCFLENKLKIRWIYPGEEGICIPEISTISFKENESFRRVPPFLWGYLRSRNFDNIHKNPRTPEVWMFPVAEAKKLTREMEKFILRQRNGRIKRIRYAHAFVKWPNRFEKTRMDYFGVSPYGKPAIPNGRKYTKLCLSNPAVIDQIIADWKAAGAGRYLNVSPNDGTSGFCRCDKCMALDTRRPGENFYAHLTDRYLNFWNRVLKRAKTVNPNVMLVTYIYSYYRHPPRREKMEYPDDMLCGLVPILAEDTGALFKAWKKEGMRHCFLRPNDTHPASTLLRGMERRIYDKFQSARKHFKLYGVDYDGTLGVRSRDFEHYVIVRMICDPKLSFEVIENEYYSAFGPAADAVRKFYTGIRSAGAKMYFNSISKTRKPMLDDSEVESVAEEEYIQVLAASLKELKNFPQTKLSAMEKFRFNRLVLTAEQSLLTAEFIRQGDLRLSQKKNDFYAAARALWDFRSAHAAELQEDYGEIIRRSERKYWMMYRPYIDSSREAAIKRAFDPASGWYCIFTLPNLDGWQPGKAFSGISDNDASISFYSVKVKPADRETVIIRRPSAVTPGAKYTVSFDAKAAVGGTFTLRASVNKNILKEFRITPKGKYWSQGGGLIVVPRGVNKIDISITAANAPQGGFVDKIIFQRIDK